MTVLTNNPTAVPAGTPWSNPTYAYADGTNAATTSTDTAYQQYGTYGFTDPGGTNVITLVRIRADAWTAGNEKITVAYSTDGGTNWTSMTSTSLTTLEATYWYDITSGRTWTWTLLNDTNFRVRVTAARTGTMSLVSLDWIPVEVTYKTTIDATEYSDTRFYKTQETTKLSDNRFIKTTDLTKYSDSTITVSVTAQNIYKNSDTRFRITTDINKITDTRFIKTIDVYKTGDIRFLKTQSIQLISDTRFKKAQETSKFSDSRSLKTQDIFKTSDVNIASSLTVPTVSTQPATDIGDDVP